MPGFQSLSHANFFMKCIFFMQAKGYSSSGSVHLYVIHHQSVTGMACSQCFAGMSVGGGGGGGLLCHLWVVVCCWDTETLTLPRS